MPLRVLGRSALLRFAVAGILVVACTDHIVFGSIPSSTFQFAKVVPRGGPGAGGWKAAQVVILLGRLSPQYPETALCEIEVGVPEATQLKIIDGPTAQAAAALASDGAARHVLKQRLPTAIACNEFRAKMESIMKDPKQGDIPGARVTSFLTPGIPRTTFP